MASIEVQTRFNLLKSEISVTPFWHGGEVNLSIRDVCCVKSALLSLLYLTGKIMLKLIQPMLPVKGLRFCFSFCLWSLLNKNKL